MKAVFTTKVTPTYKDLPEARYHFPRTYLNQVSQAIGDWILYYEPRRSSGDLMSRGGRQAYFATARVERIIADPVLADHFFAEVSHYLEFSRPVPFSDGKLYFEAALQKTDGSTNKGAFGRAVRTLPDAEYDLIWRTGFGHVIGLESRTRPAPDAAEDADALVPMVAEPRHAFLHEAPDIVDREIVSQLVSRPFRDRAFSVAVKNAYRDTCCVTGLKLINGGGRSEVEAAHIRAVQDSGPDSVRNGIALSRTAHWMFDRGLISVDDNYDLLIAAQSVPDTVLRLLRPERRLLLPEHEDLRPHPRYLDHHRRTRFKV